VIGFSSIGETSQMKLINVIDTFGWCKRKWFTIGKTWNMKMLKSEFQHRRRLSDWANHGESHSAKAQETVIVLWSMDRNVWDFDLICFGNESMRAIFPWNLRATMRGYQWNTKFFRQTLHSDQRCWTKNIISHPDYNIHLWQKHILRFKNWEFNFLRTKPRPINPSLFWSGDSEYMTVIAR
jgi:hypothetical protein